MSDFEQVQIDPRQFGLLEQRLNSFSAQLQIVTERLGPVDKTKSIQKTLEDGFALLAEALKNQSPTGDPSIKQDLQTIIEMLKPQAPVPAAVEFIANRLEIIHGLIVDLAADPEKAKELSERIQKQVEALKSAIPKPE